jgi:hypothetical protein
MQPTFTAKSLPAQNQRVIQEQTTGENVSFAYAQSK